MSNPITLAFKAKGLTTLITRSRTICSRYGLTPAKMDRALHLFSQILEQFDCGASLALTAIVLNRHRQIISNYLNRNIEFLVHGYKHIDYSRLPLDEQIAHLRCARAAFAAAGVPAVGFRSPYLRHTPQLDAAVEAAGFSFVSNQTIMWDILDREITTPYALDSYQRAIHFYNPWSPDEQLSLPRFNGQVVEIPVSLPDDEILVDRLQGNPNDLIKNVWQTILHQNYRREELFTMMFHPERIGLCADGFSTVLAEARSLKPAVWLARLEEIATWWREYVQTTTNLKQNPDGTWHLAVTGPTGISILAREVEILGKSEPWADNYRLINEPTCLIRASTRPFVGVSPRCPPTMLDFLRQHGYIFQVSDKAHLYPVYLNRTDFSLRDRRPLMSQIEHNSGPLVRLGRWPAGARSALSITGDIDALTLWDYGLRLIGN